MAKQDKHMSTIARAYEYLEPPQPGMTAEQRRLDAESDRETEVIRLANEIIADPEQLDEAIGKFGNALSFTGLFQCLSNIAQCETSEQYITQGAALKQHLRAIAHGCAEKQTPAVPAFLLRQAG